MINFNGKILPKTTTFLNHENRGLRYGDSLFETMRGISGKLFFWEDHYLRLMASMRILRMEIPMNFTMEFLQEQIRNTILANTLENDPVRIRFTVFRNNGGLYGPSTNDISYIIETNALKTSSYTLKNEPYHVELFKDFYMNADMLSNLKTNNKIIHIVGSIFAKENRYHNCLLLNNRKEVVEALNGNIFLVKDNHIKTPPLLGGCLNGIIRKRLLLLLDKLEDYTIEEAVISPFELQKADELFITNTIVGIQPVYTYRKKTFKSEVAKNLLSKLKTAAQE